MSEKQADEKQLELSSDSLIVNPSTSTKSKTISVSSTESLPDILPDDQAPPTEKMMADEPGYDNSSELFDFAKTGAIPKSKTRSTHPNSKSSLSSSTSSSLSSLISSVPSTFSSSSSNNFKTKKKSSNQNNEFNYWAMPDKVDDIKDTKLKPNIVRTDPDEEINEFKEPITCPLCFKVVEGTVEAHFEAEHNEYECPFCDLLFDNDFLLKQHVNMVHDDTLTSNKNKDDNLFDSKLPNYSSFGASNWGQNDLKSVSDSVNEQKCPVCMVVVKEGLDHLQAHVESHFNNPSSSMDYNNFKSSKSRSNSTSSLIANVDENFELDQVMTLADSDTDSMKNQDYYYSFQNDSKVEQDLIQKDYEMALMLDQQENENVYKTNNDFLVAQLYERQQKEAAKYELSKIQSNENLQIEEEYSTETSSNFQSEYEYAAEIEHEWLKQKYGMTETKASTKAISNLDRALKQNRIDIVTYNYEKDQIENRLNSLIDDGTTCSRGVIELIKSVPLNKSHIRRILCTNCSHYASGFIDSGYGCGYRNTQMILSSIREDPAFSDALFNNNNKNMPSITKIQQMIENAWNSGFDLDGKTQLGGSLRNTAKWIGASDVCAMFSFLRVRTELVDIQQTSNSKGASSFLLFKFVRSYFEEAEKTGKFIHPLYLQHDGHSRLIVGIELGQQHDNLLLFDPGTRKFQIDQFKKNPFKFMSFFRRSMNAFNKKEYQLLVIKDLIKSNDEYETAKVLTSRKFTS